MADPKQQRSIPGELTDEQLNDVHGGVQIPVSPDKGAPKVFQVSGSIAQGDTISNDDNLPDAGGGVIK
jgi:hypothetical protein